MGTSENNDGVEFMNLDRMSTDDLWSLHVEVSQLLRQRIQQEKLRLEERLKQLQTPVSGRRPCPPVPPKYCNPDKPSETWAGRGKQGLAVEIGKADRGFQNQEVNQRSACGAQQ